MPTEKGTTVRAVVLSKLRSFFTLKRSLLIVLGVVFAALSWLDYFLIYYFESPLNAAIHFYLRDFYTSHMIQEIFQGVIPLLMFLIASVGEGLLDGLMVTALSSIVFTFGKQTQILVLLLSLSYRYRFGWEYGIVATLVLAGVIGGIFSQFQIYSIMWKAFKHSFKNPKVVLPWGLFIAIPLITGKLANIVYISPMRVTFFNWSVLTNELLVMAFVYTLLLSSIPSFYSKRFWSGAIIGSSISTASFIGFLGSGSERIIHDLIWLPYYISVEGGITKYYVATTAMAALFIVVAFFWGGFWASSGRISTYTTPPAEITEPHRKAYILRDLWSNYFLLGKNKVKEFEKTIKTVTSKIRALLGEKETYITYEKMDRVPRDEIPPMPEPELEIIPLEDNKCNIRIIETGETLGPFINPDYLEEKYEPIWNPFALSYQATLVKALIPFLIVIITAAAAFFYVNIAPWISIWASPYRPLFMTGQTWLLVGSSFLFLIALILFSAYWAIKSFPALSTRPEGAPAVFTIGLLAGGLFVFLEYFILRLAEFLNINIIASPYMILLGLPPEQWLNYWFSFFEYNANLVLFAYNRLFSACLYGAIFLAIAALLIGLSGVQVIGLERYNLYFYADHGSLFPYRNRHDAPVWLEGSYYWVLRYIYLWPGEFTIATRSLYHEDYERVELWVNAETGELEWIVSDYHWRELFYRVPADGREHKVLVDFNANFHTPDMDPVHPEDLAKYQVPEASKVIFVFIADTLRKLGKRIRELLSSVRARLFEKEEEKRVRDALKKRVEYVNQYLIDIAPGARKICARVAANMGWSFWRYPFGVPTVNSKTGKYLYREQGYVPPIIESPLHPIQKRVDGEGYPAVEATQICPKCSALFKIPFDSKDQEQWTCKSCGVDVRRFSFYH